MTEDNSKSSDRLALVVGIVVALALLAWGFSAVYSNVVLDVRGVEADGNVASATYSRGTAEHPNRTYCHATIQLPGEADAHLTLHTDSETCAGLVHKPLRVRYVPGDPDNVRVASEGGFIVDLAVIATMLVAVFVIMRVLRWSLRKLRKMRADAASSRSR